MSNEYKDWKLNRVLDCLPEGWEYKAGDHINDDRFVNGDVSLTLSQAFDLVEAGYNEGYNTALNHIKCQIDRELADV